MLGNQTDFIFLFYFASMAILHYQYPVTGSENNNHTPDYPCPGCMLAMLAWLSSSYCTVVAVPVLHATGCNTYRHGHEGHPTINHQPTHPISHGILRSPSTTPSPQFHPHHDIHKLRCFGRPSRLALPTPSQERWFGTACLGVTTYS